MKASLRKLDMLAAAVTLDGAALHLPAGTTLVACTATDASGNESTCQSR